jgi:putative peptide zinc metalloprotease protein
MNLSEALDAALPEIPKARLSRSRPPRLDPDLIIREDMLDGEPIVGVLQRGKGSYYRFSPSQWELSLLFDGIRSYEEIAESFTERTSIPIEPENVRSFAEQMDEVEFWHKTHQEKNLALSEKLMAQRGRRSKSKVNLAHISFSAWDPDKYLGWLDSAVGEFVYSKWCVLAAVTLFIFEAAVFIENWKFIGPDTALFFNFTQKSFLDFVQFWVLLLVLGFVHETAHGLTCKHFGGQVHSMGLMFLYLAPCFFVDVTETWVSASKIQRLATIIAGIWIEMMICGFAMIFWLNTSTGGWLHNFAYEVILLTGIAVVVINLNPLIKLDGYYFLTEVIEIPDLKERSTAFLSGWFQNHILGLSVETPIVPRRRAALFFFYAFVSGTYSYLLLFFVVRFSYRLTSIWFAEFALIPAGALAFFIYRSRLRSLWRVTKQFWNEKFGSKIRWRPLHFFAIALAATILFLPLWRDREDAYFVIEPTHPLTLHAAMPGRVDAVLIRQGEQVHAGEPLIRMNSGTASSLQAEAEAATQSARFQANNSQLKGESISSAAAQQNGAAHFRTIANEAQSSLEIAAPTDGIVLTQNPMRLLQQNVASGQPLLDLADAGPRTVRVFIPVSALSRIPPSAEVALAIPGQFSFVRMPLSRPSGEPVALPDGLIAKQNYQGIILPVFYSSRMTLAEKSGNPMFGLAGDAKIFGARHSLAERLLTGTLNLVKAHVW